MNDFNIAAELNENRVIQIVAEHKGFTNYNLTVTLVFDFVEKSSVDGLIFIGEDSASGFEKTAKLPADIVNANEDAKDIGIVVDAPTTFPFGKNDVGVCAMLRRFASKLRYDIPLPAVFEVSD